MKLSKVKTEALTEALNDPTTQGLVAQFLGLLKLFDKNEEEKHLENMVDISIELVNRLPYDEVKVDGEWTRSPTMVCMITGYLMIEHGILPEFA